MHPESRWRWSEEFRRLLGFAGVAEFPDLVGSWGDRLHPEDAAATFAAFGACLAGTSSKAGYDVTYRLKMKDGSYRWFRAVGGVARDASGKARRVCGSLIDINTEKVAEIERGQAMHRLADTFESSVKNVVLAVSSASRQLQDDARAMSANADQTNRQCTVVAAAAEQASANVQTVASATEELTGSINEISRQVSESTRIGSTAVEEADRATMPPSTVWPKPPRRSARWCN